MKMMMMRVTTACVTVLFRERAKEIIIAFRRLVFLNDFPFRLLLVTACCKRRKEKRGWRQLFNHQQQIEKSYN
jgi:hypothetical protein